MQSCSSCAPGTMSHIQTRPLGSNRSYSDDSEILLSIFCSVIGKSTPEQAAMLWPFYMVFQEFAQAYPTLQAPSQSWEQRSRLSPRSSSLARDGHMWWSHPRAQQIKVCGPLCESPVPSWTFSWGLLLTPLCLFALLPVAVTSAFFLVG